MKKLLLAFGLALVATALRAQNTNIAFTPGKVVVYRGGDGILTIATDRQHPAFVDEYDPAISNQSAPMMSVELPTNGPSALWFNAHAGSEGQGFGRSADRRTLVMTGYSGNLGSIAGTPSGAAYPRGFGTLDASTNFNLVYASAEWFGLQPGVTQDNPRGIATDGTNNFWGTGTVAGTQSGGFQESGTLFWNNTVSPDPELVQSIVQSAYFLRIVNGVLYMVCENEAGGATANGIYDFVDFPGNGGALVPLPWAPGNVQHIITTNLFLNFGATYSKILTFDMDRAGTTVYAADNNLGVVKFVNNGGTWTSPYLFSSTNIGTSHQPKGGTGCFGIAVDFSGPNPVIYATTTEEGDGKNTCSNRLISIVDTGDPGTNMVATTLAVAGGVNEVFRGVAFTPELIPAITLQPVEVDTTTNVAASFIVQADSAFPLTYQWQKDGTNVTSNANIAGANGNVLSFQHAALTNAGSYSVIISNQYGAVTSVVATMTVSAVAVLPTLTNGVAHLTNYIGNNESFPVNPGGTPPFRYQWYFGSTPLADDNVKYFGSASGSLYITNLQLSDSGSYYVAISNAGGGISNLVAVLSVQYLTPSIPDSGEPSSITMLTGQTNELTVSSVAGTAPLSYQWYRGAPGSSTPLSDLNEFSGAQTNTLSINGAQLSDAGSYYVVVSNAGGAQTSSVVTVSVLAAPTPSSVSYSSGQIYSQDFDSLPNPGATPVNTIGGGGPVSIGGVTYDPSNPFDFAAPIYTNINQPAGGLGLAATMPGWYGECDTDTTGAQLGASDGSQTTGGVISFGNVDDTATNRALGLIATSTSGGTHFGLKLINATTTNLNYIDLSFVGEYWKLGTKPKTMAFSYNVDAAGNASTLSRAEIGAASSNEVSALTFNFPTAAKVGANNGLLPQNQTNLAVTNFALAKPWTPGSALWLVWSINDATGSGEGYGIDNLLFSASASTNGVTTTPIAHTTLQNVLFSTRAGLSFSFTNAPGIGADLSVRFTTNIALPLGQWQNLGHPNEGAAGQYSFTNNAATNFPQGFYSLISP